jgi:hypothetical protein
MLLALIIAGSLVNPTRIEGGTLPAQLACLGLASPAITPAGQFDGAMTIVLRTTFIAPVQTAEVTGPRTFMRNGEVRVHPDAILGLSARVAPAPHRRRSGSDERV